MAGLRSVAEHLSTHAKVLGSGDAEADAFGRSAFNRHYYATFLTVRELLVAIDIAWAKTPHAEIPASGRPAISGCQAGRMRPAFPNATISWPCFPFVCRDISRTPSEKPDR